MANDIPSFLGLNPQQPERQIPPSPGVSTLLSTRYSNAYTAAHSVVTIGKAIKAIAILIFLVVVIAGFAVSKQQPYGGGEAYSLGGLVLGFIVGVPIYILGIIVAALGQIALASLDTAVNTSRHLTNDEVAAVLSKRFSL